MSRRRAEISTAQLSNGMRAVHILHPRSEVAIFGLCVRAGSRNENDDEHGLAHFVEHTIFKGTQHRRAAHIIKRMESVGGELNAYTTKEETVIYSVFPAGNLSRAVDLIADLIHFSLFPDRELAKEREVVADEIESYLDSPSEAIFDDFEDLIFSGSALGHNILGDTQSLKRFDSNRCRDFVNRNYLPENIVAFYSGSRGSDYVFGVFERYLGGFVSEKRIAGNADLSMPPVNIPFDRSVSLPCHQCHCLIGTRVGSYLDEDRFATALLANITGGPGMNSLLNVMLRERRGLVYNVETTTALFSDCGLMTVYFAGDVSDVDKCRDLVYRCFNNIIEHFELSKLEASKRQYLGQLTVASENRENSVFDAARSMLWRGKTIDRQYAEDYIRSLDVHALQAVAEKMLTSSCLLYKPV